MVDVDGNFTYSAIREIDNTDKHIYVSSAGNTLTVYGLQLPAQMTVFDAGGKLVLKKDNISPGNSISIDLLPQGVYFVKVYAENRLCYTGSVFKQ